MKPKTQEIFLKNIDFFQIPYQNGKPHGVEKWYYENGKLMSEFPFENGEQHGANKGYYEMGNQNMRFITKLVSDMAWEKYITKMETYKHK